MITYKEIFKDLYQGSKEIPYLNATDYFLKFKDEYKEKFIFESKDMSPVYGRLSLIGVDPVIKLSGKNNKYKIKLLNSRGRYYFEKLGYSEDLIEGIIEKENVMIEETQRCKRKNIAEIIRGFLENFKVEGKTLLGLYGAFSYDFIRLFEDIEEKLPENDVNDFTLYLYDTFLFFDHLKEKSEIVVFRNSNDLIKKAIFKIEALISSSTKMIEPFKIEDSHFDLSQKKFEELVEKAIDYAKDGEIFEVVFSNSLKAKFEGDPFSLYMSYSKINPSPYLFFFDFASEQLVGASPEMMVRCENNLVQLRPISGTAKRGDDPIEDHENMLELLSNQKERAELDMLIDLGRNDLSRICEPEIKIYDYRYVEKYSKVMHTVAHLTGRLRPEYTALDALISCSNAGTLTGAPKVAAMNFIEKHEKERRGYYGGSIGYLTFAGDMDTGIIIRTAHIKDGSLQLRVGATLLYESKPEMEYEETLIKARAFINTLNQSQHA